MSNYNYGPLEHELAGSTFADEGHTCIDINNTPTGADCEACRTEQPRPTEARETEAGESLIDAAKLVEQWWLQLDKSQHNFYGAPAEIFTLRAAIAEHDKYEPAPRAAEREGDHWRTERIK